MIHAPVHVPVGNDGAIPMYGILLFLLGGGVPGGQCAAVAVPPPIFDLPFATHSPAMDLLGDVGNADQLTSGTSLLSCPYVCLARFYSVFLALSGMSASSLFFSFHMRHFSPKFHLQRTNRDFIISPRGEQGPAGQGEGIASSCP